jgi:HK97 family phage major capsid protein
MDNITETITALNDGFTSFKAAQNTRINAIEKQLVDDATIAASRQMGNYGSTKPASKFQAHYAAKPDYQAHSEPVSMQSFLGGIAGLKSSEGVRAALAGGVDSTGGFAIPSRLAPGILDAMTAQSSVLSAGAGITLIDGSKSYTTCATDTIPSAAWRAEAGNIAESDPAFRAIVAAPKSLAFYFKISRELLADGQDLDRALQTAIAQSFALALDAAALRGSGTAPTPRGLLNTTNVHAITSGAAGASLTNYSKLFEAVTAILGADHGMPTGAIMHPRSLVKLGGLLDTTNQPMRVPPMLENVKLLQTSQIPVNLTVGASTDCSEIYMGDFTQMQFIMRETVSVQLLREQFATTGQLAFVGHVRADVAVMRPKSFAIITGVRA